MFGERFMKTFVMTVCVLGLAANVQAHTADLSPPQHTAEHAWLLLAMIPLLALMLPLLRRSR